MGGVVMVIMVIINEMKILDFACHVILVLVVQNVIENFGLGHEVASNRIHLITIDINEEITVLHRLLLLRLSSPRSRHLLLILLQIRKVRSIGLLRTKEKTKLKFDSKYTAWEVGIVSSDNAVVKTEIGECSPY